MKIPFLPRVVRAAFSCLLIIAALLGTCPPAAAAIEGISDAALAQIQALHAEKESRTPAQKKMASRLVYAVKRSRNEAIAPGVTSLRDQLPTDARGRVEVDVTASVTPELLDYIRQSGGTVRNSFPRFKAIRATIPLGAAEQLAGRPDVQFVRPAVRAETDVGQLTTQGDVTHAADQARATFLADGAGVKVGVLSDSVDFLSQSQASGDLPAVTVLPGQAGVGDGEGTAMLEIIHDLAPGAELYFATAFNGPASFAQNILDLRAAGCDIIVDDVRYADESPFQDGIIAQAVNAVTADGAVYFASAGNSGNFSDGTSGTWEGDFADAGPVGPPVNGRGGNVHSFGATPYNVVTDPGFAVSLFWTDPLGGSLNDYDIYLLNADGTQVVDSSTDVQNGIQDPFEFMGGGFPGERIVVVKVSGDARFLHLDTGRGEVQISTTGFGRGHSAATNAFATAAVNVATAFPGAFVGGSQNPVEPFSSDGPRRVFFQADGTPITPGDFLATGGAVRQYPTIAAADGGHTTVPGFDPFFGTSAAAPHAAAVAALLKSYNPSLSPAAMRQILTETALDIEAPGVDRDSGYGIVMASAALQAGPPGVNLGISATSLPGGNGNGLVDPRECNSLVIVLTNQGLVTAHHVQASITTTTPGVIVTSRSSPYPDLLPTTGASNTVAFQFSTSPSFVCGTPVRFSVVIKSDEATLTNSLTLSSGTTGALVRYDNNAFAPIPDFDPDGAVSSVLISGFSGAVRKVSVGLHITHTFDADLVLELISPDGTVCLLSANRGGAGDNYGFGCADSSRTFFDDSSDTFIGAAAVPFVGAFRPDQPLSVFIGKSGTNVNGVWKLRVVDAFPGDQGAIQCWSLLLSPSTCVDGGGECPGSDLAIGGAAFPIPVFVGTNLTYTISVTNRGPKTATGVTVSQTLPASQQFSFGSASQGTVTHASGVVSVSFGTLPVDAVAQAFVTVLPTQVGSFVSTAAASAVSDPDPDVANNTVAMLSQVSPPTSDLAVGLVATPDPVLLGGNLAYSVSVTNRGPSAANGVIVTNTLPPSVGIVNAAPSQGTATILGNVVLFNFGGLTNNGRATGVIHVVPGALGVITATARARGNELDVIPANNTASAAVNVGPAANLSVTFVGTPEAIVTGSNLIYTMIVSNAGPSAANGVIVNQSLPAGAILLSTNLTQGTLSLNGSSVLGNIGSMTVGGTATMTVVVWFPSPGLRSSTVTVSGSVPDPDSSDNAANASTLVAAPFVSIVASGSTLIAESMVPANGTIDPGETVTIQFRLRNAGNITTTNLAASLLATNGVTAPSGPQIYGVLTPGGFPVSRSFTFTASGTNGGLVTARLRLQGDATNTVTFNFDLPNVRTFANSNAIIIPHLGAASPYPSTLVVSGVTGTVGKVTATLSNFNHTFPRDVSVLLVGPTGAKALLMSHATDEGFATGMTLTFDDSAPEPLPAFGAMEPGVWQPSVYPPDPIFPTNAAPATNPPAGPYGAALTAFNGISPNGTWRLYVMDDAGGDGGAISNGWRLSISTISPVNQLADLVLSGSGSPNPVLVGGNLTNVFTVTNAGPNTASGIAFTNFLPAGVNFVLAAPSQGSASLEGDAVICNFGNLAPGGSASITVVSTPASAGTLTNRAAVSASENDLNPANNTASVVTAAALPIANIAVLKSVAAEAIIGSNVVYTIVVTNLGPQPALNVTVTDVLPSAMQFVSSTSGEVEGGVLSWNAGTLASGGSAANLVTVIPQAPGLVTNTAVAGTTSVDGVSSNNTAAAVTLSRFAAPHVLASGARILSESFLPGNGTVEPGETVVVSLTLTNNGELNTANLIGTLQSSGGVTLPSGSQNYGALVRNGAAVSRTFSFTASSSSTGVVTATLALQDGAGLPSVAFLFPLPQTNRFANTNTIHIPDNGIASPYPSTIEISGLTGIVGHVSLTLSNLGHSFPDDIDVLLVGPAGQKVVIMSDAGGGHALTNVTLSFQDGATALPDSLAISTGTYEPTDYETGDNFPIPAPEGEAAAVLSVFNGTDPNGVWSLYVVDDTLGDAGAVNGGWSLRITTLTPANPLADLAVSGDLSETTVFQGETLTNLLTVSNAGPAAANNVVLTNVLPAGATFAGSTASQGSVTVNGNDVVFTLGTIASGETALASVAYTVNTAGTALSTAQVRADETDLNFADNSLELSALVQAIVRPQLSGMTATNGYIQFTLTGRPNETYIILSATNLAGDWVPIATNTAGFNGVFKFTDTNAANADRGFYRAVLVP